MSDEQTPSLGQRFKAFAARAGLPVEQHPAPAEPAPADEPANGPSEGDTTAFAAQGGDEPPTSQFPAVTPEPEQATGDTAGFGAIGEETEQIFATGFPPRSPADTPPAAADDATAAQAASAGTTPDVPAADPEPHDEPGNEPLDEPEVTPAPSLAERVSRLIPRRAAKPAEETVLAPDGPDDGADFAAGPAPAAALEADAPPKPSFAERASLRRRLRVLRARRDVGLLELGAIVLDQSRFGDASGGVLTRKRTDELTDLDGEIAAIEVALDEEHTSETLAASLGVVRCAHCSALLGPRDRFCAQCGTSREVAPGEVAAGGDEPATS